jgi:hypothetical protein
MEPTNAALRSSLEALGLDPSVLDDKPVGSAADLDELVSKVAAGSFVRFGQLMDGIQAARVEKRWELVHNLGNAALRSVAARDARVGQLESAALGVAQGWIGPAADLAGLPVAIYEAAQSLASMPNPEPLVSDAVARVRGELDELRLLVRTSDSRTSLEKLCSKLRRVGRPDLGIEAATLALVQTPSSVVALTTRGAAYVDCGRLSEGYRDLRDAWDVRRSHYPACALSRLFRMKEEHSEALRWASTAVDMRLERSTVCTYAAAAAASGDPDALATAAGLFARLGGDVSAEEMHDYTVVQGARMIGEQGERDLAARLLVQVLRRRPDYRRAIRALEELGHPFDAPD